MLELHSFSAGYPGKTILSCLDLAFPAGTFTAVIGPNGSGKSTLLKSLVGLIPCSGQVLYQGCDLHTLPSTERAKLLSFLPQSRQVPEITAGKLVLHGRFPYLSYPRCYRPEDLAAAKDAMEQLGISDLTDRELPSLSGGERQKVYIAMVLAQQTPVILMDEPTSFLDIAHRFEIVRISGMLAQQGKTVISVLHDLDLALKYADRILLLAGGKAVLFSSRQEAVQSGLIEKVFHIQVHTLQTQQGIHYCFLPEK